MTAVGMWIRVILMVMDVSLSLTELINVYVSITVIEETLLMDQLNDYR